MITLRLTYPQLDAFDALRRQAPEGSVIVGELVGGHLEAHIIDDALGAAIRSVVKEHVARRQALNVNVPSDQQTPEPMNDFAM
jgi:hypothetical protein